MTEIIKADKPHLTKADEYFAAGQQNYLDWCREIAAAYAGGEATQEEIAKRYEVSQPMLAKHIAIGRDERIILSKNNLPKSELVLYLLTTLPDKDFEELCKPTTTQAVILAHKKKQTPPKPKQIPVSKEQEQEEKEMPKDNFNWERIAIEEGISVAGSGGSRNIAKKEIDELDDGAIKSKDEDRLRAVCKQIYAMRNPDKAKDDAQKAKDELPKSAQDKLDSVIKKWQAVILADMQKQFNEQLAAAKAEVQLERDAVWALKRDAEAEREAALQYRLGIDSHMTMEEFQLVRNCLHPDRAPDDRRERFEKAFTIFNRLEKTVNTKAPISVLRRHGWEKVSPFHKSH